MCTSWSTIAAAEKRVRRMLDGRGVDLASASIFPHSHRPGLDCAIPARSSSAIGKATVAVTDWRFNAWAKYANWQRDDAVPAQDRRHLGLPHWQPDWQRPARGAGRRQHRRQRRRACC